MIELWEEGGEEGGRRAVRESGVNNDGEWDTRRQEVILRIDILVRSIYLPCRYNIGTA